jgi:hypothetical protein
MIEGVTLLVEAKAAGLPAPHFPGTQLPAAQPQETSPSAHSVKAEPKAGE